MKTLNLLAWVTGIIACVLVLLGLLAYVKIEFLGMNNAVNYFHVANSFLLIAIACLIKIRLMK